MEAPISKFMHVQQPDNYWHQPTSTSAFKSPDLIELNSDSERAAKPVEAPNYSSSQEEVETEDDCCDAPDSILVKEGIPGVYDVTSNDEESCHLLQTEDDSENSDSEHGDNSSKSSMSRSSSSADPTISDGEGPEEHTGAKMRQGSFDNYWEITPEQEKYYTEQFLLLQPDIKGMVNGVVAKGFFEKSRLPPIELREIWQISDVTRDGCLDLSEFKTAMHLVVLRKHNLHIPAHFYNRHIEPAPAVYSSNSVSNGPSTSVPADSNAIQSNPLLTPPCRGALATVSSAPPQPVVERSHSKKPSKDWTTFENEPVNFSSTCDTSGLVAPVPVRRLTTPEDKLQIASSGPVSVTKAQILQLKAIQRPKLSGHHPKVSSGTIAPPPPPRRKTHVRSSSLDLNRLNISDSPNPSSCLTGPEVPARSFLSPSHHGGAFSVYRKPQSTVTETIHEPSSQLSSKNTKVQLQQEVADLKNENTVLNRISTQLLDQLSGLQAKKKALNSKIQQLHTLPLSGRIS